MINVNPANKRGDKNVINGAKKTLKSVVKALPMGSEILKSLNLMLDDNKIKTNAETITWMYVGLLKFVKINDVIQTMKIYQERMKAKIIKPETHQNMEYVQKKRKRIQTYIQSAQYLTEIPSKISIFQSIEVLFEYQNCSRRALQKMQKYLQENKEQFDQIFDINLHKKFQQTFQVDKSQLKWRSKSFQQCEMMSKEQISYQFKTQEPKNEQQMKKIMNKQYDLFIDPFESEIYQLQEQIQENMCFESWDNYINLSDHNK